MLRFVRNIPYDEHPPLDDIYGDVPSIFAQVTHQRMQILGSTYKPIVALTEMLSWMLGERQTVDSVRSTLGSRRRNKGFSYVSQLLMEVREITGKKSISSVDIRDMLLGNAWQEKVVDMVYASRSKLFARAPVYQTPPLARSSNNLRQS